MEAAPPGRLGRRFLLADEAPEVEAGAAYQQTGHVEAGHVDQVAHRGAAVQAGGEGNLAAATDRRAIEQPDEPGRVGRSEEHTSELQSLMRISYAVFCLKK